jgi:hypothetical protein
MTFMDVGASTFLVRKESLNAIATPIGTGGLNTTSSMPAAYASISAFRDRQAEKAKPGFG